MRFRLAAGERVDYLVMRAEGSCFVRVRGVVVEAEPCPTANPSGFRLKEGPKTELWVHASSSNLNGWVLVDEDAIKIVDREF